MKNINENNNRFNKRTTLIILLIIVMIFYSLRFFSINIPIVTKVEETIIYPKDRALGEIIDMGFFFAAKRI